MSVVREAWQIAQIEAALSEADAGDFVPETEMAAKFNRAEDEGLSHEKIQELNRITEDHRLLSDDWKEAEQIMERVNKGEEVLYSLSDVERELGLDGDATCR